MNPIVGEALGYAVASGFALILDVGLLWIFVHFFAWEYLAAAAVSYLSGASVAYVLSVKLAFKQHRLTDRRAEFVSFVAIGTAGLAINSAVIYFGVTLLGLHYLVAKGLAAGFTFTCNFIARRQLLFVRQPMR
jgi:putative flippase GtrA